VYWLKKLRDTCTSGKCTEETFINRDSDRSVEPPQSTETALPDKTTSLLEHRPGFSSSVMGRRSSLRIREYYRKIKKENQALISAIVGRDVRPYANVTLLGRAMKGLMDTGASISCIGGNLAREIFDKNIKFKQMSSNVRTADGKSQTISGKLCLEVTYRGLTKR